LNYEPREIFSNPHFLASFCNLRVLVISPHNLGDDLVELIGELHHHLCRILGVDLGELIDEFQYHLPPKQFWK
jgi:hypothetical protein